MKVYFVTIILLLFSSVHNIEFEKLSLNTPYTLKTSDEELNYYQISLKDSAVIPNEIKVETQIIESKNPSSSTIGILNERFKSKNYNKAKKALLGQPIILDSEFIHSAIHKGENIYLAVYCEKCVYKINMFASGDISLNKNFIQMPPIRKLVEEEPLNNNNTRINMYSANGVSGLMVGFIMIFISILACIIMMNIYVHNTALVEQPLKLGRIEA